MTEATVLTGLIVHRLDLSENSSGWSSSSKKRRRQDDSEETTSAEHNERDALWRAGYFLVSSHHQEYLLIVPQNLIKQVCNAATFRQVVEIAKYSITQIASSRGPQHKQLAVLELFQDGLQVQANDTKQASTEEALTLTQFHALECTFRHKQKEPGGKPTSKDVFTITATVDAISPIIAAVPSDPFALMELYEPGNVPQSCVVVIKGAKALACHAGIQPGDILTLCRVRRQKWHVPNWFQKKGPARLVTRAPTYLFVVTDAASICWSGDASILPPMPSTTIPLVSIQGVIVSVDTRPLGPNDSDVIYSVKLNRDETNDSIIQQCQATDTLYISHYPMSRELLMGIRPGVIVRAVNIHRLPFRNPHASGGQCNYGACLRSTITLICCASERTESGVTDGNHPFSPGSNMQGEATLEMSSRCLLEPFTFSGSREQYCQYEFRRYLEQCDIKHLAAKLCSQQKTCYRHVSLDDIEEIVIQRCSRRNPNEGNNGKIPSVGNDDLDKVKKRKRDPYAEFFDHACAEEINAKSSNSTGCSLSRGGGELLFPTFVSVKGIRAASIDLLKGKLDFLLSSAQNGDECKPIDGFPTVQGGWTGSFYIEAGELAIHVESLRSGACQGANNGEALNMERHVVLCSVVSSLNHEERPSSLADYGCQLPVSFVKCVEQKCKVSAPVLADIEGVIVSCLCLGTSAAPRANQAGATWNFARVDLPLLAMGETTNERRGSCFLFEYNGLLFIAMVQLRCGFLSDLAGPTAATETKSAAVFYEKTLQAQRVSSIRECLERDEKTVGNNEQSFEGLLVRQRFRFVKIRKDTFLGCTLTLSHLPKSSLLPNINNNANLSASRVSAVQSIELKLSISIPREQLDMLQKSMRKLLGDNVGGILQEQTDLAAAWWRISDDSTCSSLVVNGLDDFVSLHGSKEKNASSLSVPIVIVPFTAIREGDHGYLRFQCDISDIRSSFIEVTDDSRPQKATVSIEARPVFDAVGGLKFFPGSLDRRPLRRSLYSHLPLDRSRQSRLISGELLTMPSDCDIGVSASTLADLHWKICTDMRNHSQSELAPSMVRVIRNATLLTLSFCRAMAECSKCFQPLKQRKSNHGKDRPVSGVVTSVKAETTERYWHLPFPMVGDDKSMNHNPSHSRKASLHNTRPHTTLVCPNGCLLEHAQIKWECSGVIDDGSGQAKLYAERETALSLLGSGLRVYDIEAGAWHLEGGVMFQKAVPPKSFVKQSVLEAQALAQAEMNRRPAKTRRRLVDEDVIKFLTVEVRAEYYLQQHCRKSSEPARPLDYFVRCKPLSKEAISLNQTSVEMAIPPVKDYMQASCMDVTTYSLPPLKLSLVDCSVPRYEALTTTEVSWDLVRALKETTKMNC